MRVEQAVYGEVQGRGHGLRASSPDALVAAAIASNLDLPDAVPPGVQAWSPFVRGFPVDQHYVLARTFLDTTASRGGMVLTHALIVSLDEVSQMGNLTALLACLAPTASACPTNPSAIEVQPLDDGLPPAPDLIGAANAIAGQRVAPAVRLGVEGFENLVHSLWRNLWPAMRRTFAFRLSFGPNDLVDQPPPALVCTPEQLQARWTQHRIVKPDDQAAESASAAVLCGQADAAQYLALGADLGVQVADLRVLSRLERLHSLEAGSDSFDDLLAAVRLADGLSNQRTSGGLLKDSLLQRLAAQLPTAGCKQLLQMRNLSLDGFSNAPTLWSKVVLLVSELKFAPADDADLVNMVEASQNPELALASWRSAVASGLSAAAVHDNPGFLKAIWRWVERSDAASTAAIEKLRSEFSVEQRLVQEIPRRLIPANHASLVALLRQKGWLIAHGAVLAATVSPLEATLQQLKVDKALDHTAGLRAALRHATLAQTLEAAIVLKDPRLVEMCADLAVAQPEVLTDIGCEDLTEQKIWAAAIGKSNSLWSAPSNPVAVRDTVLVHLGRGTGAFNGLVEAIAGTPLADLTAAPDRPDLWSLLPMSHRNLYLRATAVGWLNAAVAGADINRPEPELEEAVMTSSTLQAVLGDAAVPVQTRLAIVSALPLFREEDFVSWLGDFLRSSRALPHADADQLGTLVASRRWQRAVTVLCNKLADRRYDLKPALQQCASLLNLFQRWTFGIFKPSADDKWRVFEETACELYPTGPDCEELWSRAGGKNSDLPGSSQTGATRWHTALRSVRYGGRPNARELLAKMREDRPGNEKLRLFTNDVEIVG